MFGFDLRQAQVDSFQRAVVGPQIKVPVLAINLPLQGQEKSFRPVAPRRTRQPPVLTDTVAKVEN
jgi:hypothetical protein